MAAHKRNSRQSLDGEKANKKKFKSYPIGFFHIDIAEVRDEPKAGSICW